MDRDRVIETFEEHAKEVIVVDCSQIRSDIVFPAYLYEMHRFAYLKSEAESDSDNKKAWGSFSSFLSTPYESTLPEYMSENILKRTINELVNKWAQQVSSSKWSEWYSPSKKKMLKDILASHILNLYSQMRSGEYTFYFTPVETFDDCIIDFGNSDEDSCFRKSGGNRQHFEILKHIEKQKKGAWYVGIADDSGRAGRMFVLQSDEKEYLCFNVYGDFTLWEVLYPFTLAISKLNGADYWFFVDKFTDFPIYLNDGKAGCVAKKSRLNTEHLYLVKYDLLDCFKFTCNNCNEERRYDYIKGIAQKDGKTYLICKECASWLGECSECGIYFDLDSEYEDDEHNYLIETMESLELELCPSCLKKKVFYCSVCGIELRMDKVNLDSNNNIYCYRCYEWFVYECNICFNKLPADDIVIVEHPSGRTEILCNDCSLDLYKTAQSYMDELNIRPKVGTIRLHCCPTCGSLVPKVLIRDGRCSYCGL